MAMVPGTEEDPSRGTEGWERQAFPLKVKNTFISEDALSDDEGDDNAFGRRQVSAPATCANTLNNLPQSPIVGGLDGQIAFPPRIPDFQLSDAFSPNLAPVDEDVQEKGRKKKSDGADRANASADNMMQGFQAPSMPPPPAWANTTTVMMRNLPNKYTQRMLLTEINQTGFLGTFDFLYLPIDPETNANRGYAFLNFIDSGFAWMFKMSYEGRKMNRFNSSKVVNVMAATLQGFEANYAHYTTARVSRGDPAARPLFLREPSQPVPQVSTPGPKARSTNRKQPQQRLPNNGLAMAQQNDIFMSQQALLMQSPAMTAMGQPAPPWNGETNLIGFEGLAQERNNIAQVEAAEVFHQSETPTEPMRVKSGFGSAAAGGGGGKQNLVPKFCPHCGGPIQPHFQFCPHCGNTISFSNLGQNI